MACLEVLKFSPDITPENVTEISEFPGPVAITTVDHPDNPRLGTTVGIFIPDEQRAWTVMSRFQETNGNILILKPARDGDLTLNGKIIPPGANVTIEEQCKIIVHYVNDEGGWR